MRKRRNQMITIFLFGIALPIFLIFCYAFYDAYDTISTGKLQQHPASAVQTTVQTVNGLTVDNLLTAEEKEAIRKAADVNSYGVTDVVGFSAQGELLGDILKELKILNAKQGH